MKKILLLNFFTALSVICYAQGSFKRIRIPLDNVSGVPYEKAEGSYLLGGFEVDTNGYFYFMGGAKTTLAVYKQNVLLLRKKYTGFSGGNLLLASGKLYTFDMLYNPATSKYKNNIVELQKTDGLILNVFKQIPKSPVNSYTLTESGLITEQHPGMDITVYSKYDLSGIFKKKAINKYDLPALFFPKSYIDRRSVNFLGLWKGYHIYQSYSRQVKIEFWAVDAHGVKKLLKVPDNKLAGKSFIETPHEFVKLRNGNIYIAGYEGKDLLITEFAIGDLF